MDANDHEILENWYNSLIEKGSLNWNFEFGLCGQYGITCDGPIPQRLTRL